MRCWFLSGWQRKCGQIVGQKSTYCPCLSHKMSISHPLFTHLHNLSTFPPNIPPQIINKSTCSLWWTHLKINILSSNPHFVNTVMSKTSECPKLDIVHQHFVNILPTKLTLSIWDICLLHSVALEFASLRRPTSYV